MTAPRCAMRGRASGSRLKRYPRRLGVGRRPVPVVTWATGVLARWLSGSVGGVEVELDDVGGGVELDAGVVVGGGADGVAGGGDLVGAGVVGQVDLAVGVAPEVDAGEGLAGGPVAVGLDPVVVAAQRSVVPDLGPEVLGEGAVGGGGVRDGVVDVDLAGGVGGVGEGVGGGHQVHGLAVSVGDLVGVDGGLVGGVEDGLDGVGVQRAEVVVEELVGQGSVALGADHGALAGGQVLGGQVQVEGQWG